MKSSFVLRVWVAAVMAAHLSFAALNAQETEEPQTPPVEQAAEAEAVAAEAPAPEQTMQPAVVSETPPVEQAAEAEAVAAEAPAPKQTMEPSVVSERPPVEQAAEAEAVAAEAPAPEQTMQPAVVSKEALQPESFDIDRGEKQPEPVPVAVPAQEQSFWGRLFGRKPEPQPAPTETAAAAETAEQPADAGSSTPEQKLAQQEEVRRQAAEIEAMRSLKAADQAMADGEYEAAVALLNQVAHVMPRRPQTIAVLDDARRKQADCEYRVALIRYKEGRLQDARDACRRAQQAYPADKRPARLADRIAGQESDAAAKALVPRHPKKTEEYANKRAKLQAALKRGRQYMEIKDYEKAKYEFRSVLIEDPENEDAIFSLRQIAERQYDTATDRFSAYQKDRMTDVRNAWTPPIKQEIAAPAISPGGGEGIISSRRRRLMGKLNTIVIPQLDFRQANIVDVIEYLKQQSMAGDTQSLPAEKGVNLILNLKRPGEAESFAAPPPPPDADPFAPAAPAALPVATGIPSITLSLNNILLIDAIKYITEVTGLKYRIEDDVVVITPADVVYGDVVTKTYRVQPTIQEIFMSGGAPSGEGAQLTYDLGVETRAERGDVRSFFVEAGVPFPEGTSIVYKPSINLLIVSNTEENLEKLDRILATLDVIPKQVEIEARFVEISQKDLMELGVEWNLTDDWLIAQQAGAGAAVPLSARERVQVNKNTFSKGLRTLSSGGTPASGGDLAGILSISSILTNPELTFILHALEQRNGVNLLSAPKVTTKSGANAEIKVVKELIYPTQFESIEAPTAAGYEGTIPRYMSPTAFEVRDLGVVLNVTPIVAPDGYTIDLTMLPQVVELADWVNYGSTVYYPDGSSEQINIPQPIFHSRSIATSISIWDGQTVVMGGMITEGQSTTEDKIPFLGDIPLIGYLFRSETKMSEKRNLLIFVTARLMDLAGNKAQTETAEPMRVESR